ncbi:D-alanyl-D-alanine carboxypeptidase family protein [Bradyrhizobium sp. SRS-191]|uniref:D-alanyl-D-alanine carboxypeptidase family protein n=1 Tax=Bradyrhizobium sp. SRS-191 TaxID=2962606 RepID=UPI00211DB1DD|nr:D-alanyl-D-alanine carboxypeptidase family protein [Bradyrhizobium sp. SRS-191]
MMSSQQFTTRALCRSVVLAGCVIAWPASAAEPETTTPVVAEVTASTTTAATAAQALSSETALTTASITPSAPLPVDELVAPVASGEMPKSAVASADRIEILDECPDIDACVDRYLFALYERAPKLDKIRETERRVVSVKRKGRMVKVTRSFTKLVDNDFAWKDPKAAERVGRSMAEYVIGGMDRGFKLKLFHTLHAAEAAGLAPGITSGFRDDYRQEIASGLKAATNRSYHGGSLRGGYGHGLAADIVSVNGATRAQRWVATEQLWKWVDANGKSFGVGRPYLDRDPPHVGPVDGEEYTKHRTPAVKVAAAETKKGKRIAARSEHHAAKRAKAVRASALSSRRTG